MKRKEIKYVGFYSLPDNVSDRVSVSAAMNKMDYIASALVEIGYRVRFVSPSWMGDQSRVRFERGKLVQLQENIIATFCTSWRTKGKPARNVKILFSLLWLFLYLVRNVKEGEKVLAYHVQWISWPIRAARKLKKFELILEVEEIYHDVMTASNLLTSWEKKLLNSADFYIFSTDLLNNRLGNEKQYIVLYGQYNLYPKLGEPPKDGKIHLLYAGIIDKHKRGAFNALEAVRYLDDKYLLHFIGFGEINELVKTINEHNKTYACKAVFDGQKFGEEYVRYCQSCHIGLSTQSMDGDYLQSSFPSKILSYLSMGLSVVSCYIECVAVSGIGGLVTYYNDDTPKDIADTIMRVKTEKTIDYSAIIKKLHSDFKADLSRLIV